MDLLQTWIVIGVPGLLTAGVCFVGTVLWRNLLGYVVLLLTLLSFVLIPGDVISAAVIGVLLFLLVATGRGFSDTDRLPHHKLRGRFTTAAGS